MNSKYASQNLAEKIVPETEPVAFPKTCSERIVSNPHFARLLRQRLENRHRDGALRETLARLSDQELVDMYLKNEQQGRDHLATSRVQNLLARAAKQAVSE